MIDRVHLHKGDTGDWLLFHCLGCKSMHSIPVSGNNPWKWNDSVTVPTLEPSVLVNKGQGNPTMPICHSYITDGRMRYLSDCTHEMAGQTVDLPQIEDWMRT